MKRLLAVRRSRPSTVEPIWTWSVEWFSSMIVAFLMSASSVWIRPSTNACSFLASSYSAFSERSPCSLASWIRLATSGRLTDDHLVELRAELVEAVLGEVGGLVVHGRGPPRCRWSDVGRPRWAVMSIKERTPGDSRSDAARLKFRPGANGSRGAGRVSKPSTARSRGPRVSRGRSASRSRRRLIRCERAAVRAARRRPCRRRRSSPRPPASAPGRAPRRWRAPSPAASAGRAAGRPRGSRPAGRPGACAGGPRRTSRPRRGAAAARRRRVPSRVTLIRPSSATSRLIVAWVVRKPRSRRAAASSCWVRIGRCSTRSRIARWRSCFMTSIGQRPAAARSQTTTTTAASTSR